MILDGPEGDCHFCKRFKGPLHLYHLVLSSDPAVGEPRVAVCDECVDNLGPVVMTAPNAYRLASPRELFPGGR